MAATAAATTGRSDIQVYLANTPNGSKIPIALEELGIPYDVHHISFAQREQFREDFLRISPNNKIPAIVDLSPPFGGGELSVFESVAILQYLAGVKKPSELYPSEPRARVKTNEWLYWQVRRSNGMVYEAPILMDSDVRYLKQKRLCGLE